MGDCKRNGDVKRDNDWGTKLADASLYSLLRYSSYCANRCHGIMGLDTCVRRCQHGNDTNASISANSFCDWGEWISRASSVSCRRLFFTVDVGKRRISSNLNDVRLTHFCINCMRLWKSDLAEASGNTFSNMSCHATDVCIRRKYVNDAGSAEFDAMT